MEDGHDLSQQILLRINHNCNCEVSGSYACCSLLQQPSSLSPDPRLRNRNRIGFPALHQLIPKQVPSPGGPEAADAVVAAGPRCWMEEQPGHYRQSTIHSTPLR